MQIGCDMCIIHLALHIETHEYVTELNWYETESGTVGRGVIALVALVLSISFYDAAGQAAHFLSAIMDSASFFEAP